MQQASPHQGSTRVSDVDRELKEIQLQRERLALEREMAMRGAMRGAASAVGSIATGIAAPFKALGGLVTRWWKGILLVAALVPVVGGLSEWKIEYDRQQEKVASQAKLARWEAASITYAGEQCPEHKFQCTEAQTEKYEACRKNATGYVQLRLCIENGCIQNVMSTAREICLESKAREYKEQNPFINWR